MAAVPGKPSPADPADHDSDHDAADAAGYEPPRALRLSQQAHRASGTCSQPGSGDYGFCTNGSTAGGHCRLAGMLASGNCMFDGDTPAGNCVNQGYNHY
jgi:hypothetical protein